MSRQQPPPPPPKHLDENDKAIVGQLPADLTSDVERVNDVARVRTVRDLLGTSLAKARVQTRPKQCTSGIARLDEAAGGIRDGWSWLVGAESSWGKSTLAVHLADENLRADPEWEVMIVSFEDAEEIYADRLMCRRAKVNADHLRLGGVTQDEFRRMVDVAHTAERKPVFLDARDRSAEWATEQVRRILEERRGIRLVIWDYLQEARSKDRHQDRRNEVSHVHKLMKGVVTRAGRSNVVLSQLNEETGPNGFPTRASIAESRDPCKSAEVILLGFTPTKDMKKNDRVTILAGTRCLYVDKVKQGKSGFVLPLHWNDDAACFERTGYAGDHGDAQRYEQQGQEQAPLWAQPRPGDIDEGLEDPRCGA